MDRDGAGIISSVFDVRPGRMEGTEVARNASCQGIAMLDRYFKLGENQTTVAREILAGVTTFLAMAYILVVQPSVLSRDIAGNATGLEPGAVLLATGLASAFATLLMGCYARLPFALAPGMGQNFFFVSVIMALTASEVDQPWQSALGIVLVAGILFVIATVVGLRKAILDVMSPSMRSAMAVGIGLFIAFIGLKNAEVLVVGPSLVSLNSQGLWSAKSMVFWTGLGTTLLLSVRRVPGSILLGMVVATLVAWASREITIDRIWGWPEFETAAVLRVDIRAAFTSAGLVFVAMFLFMDIFDTTGTLVGVSQQAGLLNEQGDVPRVHQAMLADSMGTVVGACLGTSTVTTFIESAAGVEQGGRTGLTAVTTAVLFLAALAVSPLVLAVGGYPPITAGALVLVGAMMFRGVRHIDWSDETESIPAFFVIVGIPLFFSIADGIALGLILWPWLKIARGRIRDVPPTAIILSVCLIAFVLKIRVAV